MGRCLEVQLTDLEPVDRPPTRLIVTELALEHLHHKTLAAILDAVLQESLDLIHRLRIRCLRKLELEIHRLEVLLEQFPPLREVLLQ